MRFWELEKNLELGETRRTSAGVILAGSSEVKARQKWPETKIGSRRHKKIPTSTTACAGFNLCTESTLVTND